ncbi:hypothetical protein FGO68_gene193 [Halteria grandinella]|uniref:Uncharacterized protein n=1 Tax=Halteria grandinella TaxID=5974 RepID=A0A8J8SZI7_HALGN|nr:hypothetical protein FGO68_gene193 [Halteria grandinella]
MGNCHRTTKKSTIPVKEQTDDKKENLEEKSISKALTDIQTSIDTLQNTSDKRFNTIHTLCSNTDLNVRDIGVQLDRVKEGQKVILRQLNHPSMITGVSQVTLAKQYVSKKSALPASSGPRIREEDVLSHGESELGAEDELPRKGGVRGMSSSGGVVAQEGQVVKMEGQCKQFQSLMLFFTLEMMLQQNISKDQQKDIDPKNPSKVQPRHRGTNNRLHVHQLNSDSFR